MTNWVGGVPRGDIRDATGRWCNSRSAAQCPMGQLMASGHWYMCRYDRGHVEVHAVETHGHSMEFTGRWAHVGHRRRQLTNAHVSGYRRQRRKHGYQKWPCKDAKP